MIFPYPVFVPYRVPYSTTVSSPSAAMSLQSGSSNSTLLGSILEFLPISLGCIVFFLFCICALKLFFSTSEDNLKNKTNIEIKKNKAKITADEMFKELGYVKTKDTKECKEYKKGLLIIDIFKYDMDKNAWAYIKSKRDPYDNMETTEPIHESEDKAIHKKLEELKNEKKYISQEN